jgi:hypothetical protein
MDPAVVGEALVVDPAGGRGGSRKASVVDPTAVSEATTVQAWRRSRIGRMGGGEMIVARVRV